MLMKVYYVREMKNEGTLYGENGSFEHFALQVDIVVIVSAVLVILAIVTVNSKENDMFSASAVVTVTIMTVFAARL